MATTTITNQLPKGIHITLWVFQVLLSAMMLLSGFMKVTTPYEQLAVQATWLTPSLEWLIRFIGVSELLGAVGLIVPALTRIRPVLTVWAAIGVLVIMILALLFHFFRSEFSAIIVNVAIGGAAAFVAWGRSKKAVIHAR